MQSKIIKLNSLSLRERVGVRAAYLFLYFSGTPSPDFLPIFKKKLDKSDSPVGRERKLAKISYSLILAFYLILLPLSSIAADNTTTARWYKIYWNKIYIADLKASISENEVAAKIQSYGTVKAISKYANYTYTKFHKNGDQYIPEEFISNTTQRQGKKDVVIKYGNDGKILEESVTPPDKRHKRPAVEDNLKIDAFNPAFAAIIARDKIGDGLANGKKKFHLNIYDGRRLSKLEFNIIGRQTIKVLEKNTDVVKIEFRRIPVAGFTNNELKRMNGEEPDFSVYLNINDLLPVKADAVAPLGKASFILEKECKSIEECK